MQIKGRRHLKINANGTADTNSPAIGLWNRDARPGTTLARLETAYLSGIEGFDRMQTRSREHAASGKLTPDGVKQALVQSALGEAVPSLHRSRQTIKNAKSELAELRARVKPPASDNTDLVSAMLRAEMRDWLRSKPQAERDKITVNAETMDAVSWSRLSEQNLRADKWSLCRG